MKRIGMDDCLRLRLQLRGTSGRGSQLHLGRPQAKTRHLVLRETVFGHNQYKKYFQLIHVSI
jgi:hypothetical protein